MNLYSYRRTKRGFGLLKEYSESVRRSVRDRDDSLPVEGAEEHLLERVGRGRHHGGMGGKVHEILKWQFASVYLISARSTKLF